MTVWNGLGDKGDIPNKRRANAETQEDRAMSFVGYKKRLSVVGGRGREEEWYEMRSKS